MNLEKVRELRARTGAGIVECKNALTEADSDLDKAVDILRKKGLALAAKKVGRVTKEGIVDAYIHPGDRLGVLIEANCETDFVARTQEFKRFIRDIALQIAASEPIAVSREELPSDVIEREKEIYRSMVKDVKKPPEIIEKIVNGKLEKFYSDVCLLEQPFVKIPEKTVSDYIKEQIAKFGENIVIRRFVRFRLGE
ncbi:MAG: translation elongation factor Ts [Candidatus Stahlbacteria bacterium]|jgi:elongation factor Ts|nr:translation elongation factor Ts [candidate division WOR-3 bacterium]NOR17123.1 translation elongation factor Ts [candidate division WOR-3 bacterium]TET59205.1 MAG: translation elongation factor Ts [Candidatus Stahlbacteria bacterium]